MGDNVSFDKLTTLQFNSRVSYSYINMQQSDIKDKIVKQPEAETYTGYKLNLVDSSVPNWKYFGRVNFQGDINVYSTDFSGDNLNRETKVFTANFDKIPAGANFNVPYIEKAESYYLKNTNSITDNGLNFFNTFKDEATRTMTFALANDLVVEGKLNVGSLWSHQGQTVQGAISGEYATIDLQGHTLTVKSGAELNGMSLITDSVGTGKIVVENGGKVLTPFVITNFRGGTISTARKNANQFPFDDYMMPYLDCAVEVNYGGHLIAHTSANALSMQPELDINFIGPDSEKDKPLFALSEGAKVVLSKSYSLNESGKVDRNTYVENMKFSGDISITGLVADVSGISIDTKKMALPFSQYLHVEHTDGVLSVSAFTQIMSGAYLSTSETSTISLKDSGSDNAQSGIFAMKPYVDTSINYKNVQYSGYDEAEISNNSSLTLGYYQVNRPESIPTGVYIKGNIEVEGTGHVIGGNISLDDAALNTILDNADKFEVGNYNAFTTSLHYSNESGTFIGCGGIFGIFNKLSVVGSASFYQTLPLVTEQGVYIKSGSEIIKAVSFDEGTGVATTAEGKTYALFLPNETWKFKGSVKENGLGSWQEVTLDAENHVVKYNDKNYIYFLGAMNEATNNGTNWTINNKRFLYNWHKTNLVVEGLTMQFVNNAWSQLL